MYKFTYFMLNLFDNCHIKSCEKVPTSLRFGGRATFWITEDCVLGEGCNVGICCLKGNTIPLKRGGRQNLNKIKRNNSVKK